MTTVTHYTNEGETYEAYENEIVFANEGALMPWAGPEAGWYVLNGPTDDPDNGDIRGPFKAEMDAVDFIAARERPEFPVYYDAQGREHAEF